MKKQNNTKIDKEIVIQYEMFKFGDETNFYWHVKIRLQKPFFNFLFKEGLFEGIEFVKKCSLCGHVVERKVIWKIDKDKFVSFLLGHGYKILKQNTVSITLIHLE
jgi:hypothetical protein